MKKSFIYSWRVEHEKMGEVTMTDQLEMFIYRVARLTRCFEAAGYKLVSNRVCEVTESLEIALLSAPRPWDAGGLAACSRTPRCVFTGP